MLYIVPSRGRPRNVTALIEAWAATRTGPSHLWIAVDDDDPTLNEYREQLDDLPDFAQLFIVPRKRLGPTLSDLAVVAQKMGYRDIGFMGDDHRPRTHGWDALLAKAVDGYSAGVYYGNDLIQGPNLPTAVLMTGDIVQALGYFCPPGMTHLYLDNAWKDIGAAVGNLRYLPNIVIEHVHPIAGKAEWDDGYREVNAGEMYAADKLAYDAWVADPSWREALGGIRG